MDMPTSFFDSGSTQMLRWDPIFLAELNGYTGTNTTAAQEQPNRPIIQFVHHPMGNDPVNGLQDGSLSA